MSLRAAGLLPDLPRLVQVERTGAGKQEPSKKGRSNRQNFGCAFPHAFLQHSEDFNLQAAIGVRSSVGWNDAGLDEGWKRGAACGMMEAQ